MANLAYKGLENEASGARELVAPILMSDVEGALGLGRTFAELLWRVVARQPMTVVIVGEPNFLGLDPISFRLFLNAVKANVCNVRPSLRSRFEAFCFRFGPGAAIAVFGQIVGDSGETAVALTRRDPGALLVIAPKESQAEHFVDIFVVTCPVVGRLFHLGHVALRLVLAAHIPFGAIGDQYFRARLN